MGVSAKGWLLLLKEREESKRAVQQRHGGALYYLLLLPRQMNEPAAAAAERHCCCSRSHIHTDTHRQSGHCRLGAVLWANQRDRPRPAGQSGLDFGLSFVSKFTPYPTLELYYYYYYPLPPPPPLLAERDGT